MRIENVCIIGGGTSGWMTASALVKVYKKLKSITLVESPDFSTVGVGESTIATFNTFRQVLGINDSDWMKDCNATYKSAIGFTDFRDKNSGRFLYPFGGIDLKNHFKSDPLRSYSLLRHTHPDKFNSNNFSDYVNPVNSLMTKMNKLTYNREGLEFDSEFDLAYHLDASLFGQWLKNNICLKSKNFRHILATVKGCEYTEDGEIKNILCDDEKIKSDLYIDCTGFKSLLLEQWMGQEFQSFEKNLANNSAWHCHIPYVTPEKEMTNFTNCTALDNGWVWNIPLWNRMGSGYVYSNKFVDKNDALMEFISHLSSFRKKEDIDKLSFKHIDIRHGKRKNAWYKNVVGIGLSYGFVEPLESTSLVSTHDNIMKLCEILGRRDGYLTKIEKQTYNYTVKNVLLDFKTFVSMHYALSQRDYNPYWNWCSQQANYENIFSNEDHEPDGTPFYGIQKFLWETLSEYNSWELSQGGWSLGGLLYISAGLGIFPFATENILNPWTRIINPSVKPVFLENLIQQFDNVLNMNVDILKDCMNTYDFMKQNIYT